MAEDFYINDVFQEKCRQDNVHIEDVEHWTNEGTRFEFKRYDDLEKAVKIYLDSVAKDPDGIWYKMQVHADAENGRYFLWSLYPDE